MEKLSVIAGGAALGILSTGVGSFLVFRKNRILNGVPKSALEAFGAEALFVIVPLALVILLCVVASVMLKRGKTPPSTRMEASDGFRTARTAPHGPHGPGFSTTYAFAD
jgi:hypothetical protein